MGLITDVGSALQDEIDYIYLSGATGLHNRFGNLYNLVNGNIEVTNLKASAVTGSGTKVVLETSPTINTPTISSPTISGTVAGSPTFSGNLNFNGTNLFSTATADANRFHGAGDTYGGGSTILSVTTDALASNNFNYLKCVADYNGTPLTVFSIGAGGSTTILAGSELTLGNSSLRESSANVITAKTNGVDRLSINNTQLALGASLNLIAQSGKRLYLDGGSNTSIRENAADQISFETGGSDRFSIETTTVTFGTTVDARLQSGKKFYLDGGSNTSIRESAADTITFETGGSDRLSLNGDGKFSSVYSGSGIYGFEISGGSPSTGQAIITQTSGNGSTLILVRSSGSSSNAVCFDISDSSTGNNSCVEFNRISNSASNISTLKLLGTNSGAGNSVGLNVSNASLNFMFEVPQDNTDPTGGGGAATGRIPILVNGVTRYIPYY